MTSRAGQASSTASGTGRSTGSGRSGSGSGTGAAAALSFNACAFTLGERRFALDVALVGEVTPVESLTPVPLAHAAIVGLFNLRGLPVPAVELAAILGFDDVVRRPSRQQTALVVRAEDLVAGLLIDHMDAVVPAGTGSFTLPSAADENALVVGFLEVPGAEGALTVLDAAGVIERLRRVGFVARED